MTNLKSMIILVMLFALPLTSYANSSDARIKHTYGGYIISYLPNSLMRDFYNLNQNRLTVTIIHPNYGMKKITGYGYPADLNAIYVYTSDRITDLPDDINISILLDSTNKYEKRTYYRHVDNQMFWTFKGRNENPDDLTGIPTGPQPYYCGTELCSCVIGTAGEESCDGMGLVAKGACRTNDGIKTCCQTAGTTPVDTNGGTTTTCVNAGNS